MEKVLLVYIGPMVGGLCVGLIIAGLFDPMWLQMITSIPVAGIAWYAFRGLGGSLTRDS